VTIREADLPRLSGAVPASFTPALEPAGAVGPPPPPDAPQKIEKPRAETPRSTRSRRQVRPSPAAPCDDSCRRNPHVQTCVDFGKAYATDLKSVGRCSGALLAG